MSLVALATLLTLVAAITALWWARTDGGPGRCPPPRAEDDWSDLPSRPYSH